MSFTCLRTLIGGVLGSIYAGVATVTEAAALGAVGSVIIALLRKELGLQGMRGALWSTTITTGSIVWLIVEERLPAKS